MSWHMPREQLLFFFFNWVTSGCLSRDVTSCFDVTVENTTLPLENALDQELGS